MDDAQKFIIFSCVLISHHHTKTEEEKMARIEKFAVEFFHGRKTSVKLSERNSWFIFIVIPELLRRKRERQVR